MEDLMHDWLIDAKQKFECGLITACEAKGFTLNLTTASDFIVVSNSSIAELRHIPTDTLICRYTLQPTIERIGNSITATYEMILV